jgi:hypothetical protein
VLRICGAVRVYIINSWTASSNSFHNWSFCKMSQTNIKDLIGQPESVILEYKTVVPPPPIIARIISSFANSQGGIILCGINDDGTVKGLDDDVPTFQTVESALSLLAPRPKTNHYSVKIDDKNIYAIEVEKSDTPIVTEGKSVYKRVNDRLVISPPAHTQRIIHGRNRKLTQLAELIEIEKTKTTESKFRFFEQYTNLVRLLNRSEKILYPEAITVPPIASEGKALIRLILSSLADTFEGYLADLLYEIYLAKPETLKSNSTITTQDVLSCQSIDEIIRFIANKKISSLKKGNVIEFIDENKQIKNLNVFSLEISKQIDDIFQIRHLFVHNNGRIDAKYLSFSNEAYKLGDELILTVQELCDFAELFIRIVSSLDQVASNVYSLSLSDRMIFETAG